MPNLNDSLVDIYFPYEERDDELLKVCTGKEKLKKKLPKKELSNSNANTEKKYMKKLKSLLKP